MASFFPGGQDSFTPKVDLVDTVLASHVNDLQNAVASLEIGGVSKQNIAYAASITPNVPAGEYVIVGTLTGNITINAPTNALTGRRLTFRFTQDGTGGRTVTWNAVFKVTNWTVNTGANAVTEATFTYDGTSWFLALNPAPLIYPQVFNVKHPSYGAKGDGRIYRDGAITSGLAVFTSAGIQAGDVGKQVCIAGAGTVQGGANGGYKGTILSVVAGVSAVMDTNATATVSSAIATIGTDDTAAIQAAINDAITAGGGTVYRPASTGLYLLNSYSQEGVSNTRYNLKVGKTSAPYAVSNIRLLSDGRSAALQQGPAGSVAEAATFKVNVLILNTGGFVYDALALFAFNAVARGDQSITMTTAADAANWVAGDVIWLRSGAAGNGAPNGEQNIVTSVNAGTGVIKLKWPTVKAYAAAGTYGAGNATTITAQNLVLENEWHYSLTQYLQVWTAIIGLTLSGCYLDSVAGATTISGDQILPNANRAITVKNCEFVWDGTGCMQLARSTVDVLIADSRFQQRLGVDTVDGAVYFTENSAKLMVRGCEIRVPGCSAGTASAVATSDAWDAIVENNYIAMAAITSPGTAISAALADCPGGVAGGHGIEFRGNFIDGPTTGFAALISSDGTVFEGNRIRTPARGVWLRANAAGARLWALANRLTMVGSTLPAFDVNSAGGNSHDYMVMGNVGIAESGTPSSMISIANNGAMTKSATVIGNYGKGFTNGLLVGSVANEVGLVCYPNDFSGCTNPYSPTNPMGGIVAITPGASPYTYTAGTTSAEEIYIDGGTVTTVAKNAITVHNFGAAAARCRIKLHPGEALVVTYTVVPVMNKERVAA